MFIVEGYNFLYNPYMFIVEGYNFLYNPYISLEEKYLIVDQIVALSFHIGRL
jgi:hypothetical protein